MAGVLFATSQGYAITAIASVYVVAAAATMVCLSAIALWKFVTPKIEVDVAFWRTILRQAWPFALVSVFLTGYYWADSIMLSFMRGNEEVGLYNVAYRLLLTLGFIPQAYLSALFPVMSRLYVSHISSEKPLSFILERSLKYMFIIAMPIALGTTLLAHRIVIQIYGPEYGPATRALQILVWTILVQFASSVFVVLFNSANRQRVVALYIGLTLLANVALNAILIPKFGLVGASIATVVTSSMSLGIAFVYSFKTGYLISIKTFGTAAIRVLAATAVMGVFVNYFEGLNLLALIPISAAIYFAVLLAIKCLDKQDLTLIRSIVKR